MSTALSARYVPLEDFLEMQPEQGVYLEWWRGVVFRGMSGGTAEHARLIARLAVVLSSLAGHDCTPYASADVWVDAAQFYGQADAYLVCGALKLLQVQKHGKNLGEALTNPIVVVEVLSPSTESRDRGVKLEAYKQLVSLEDYVLISQKERRVEVHHRIDGEWTSEVATGNGSVTIHGKLVTLDALYGAPPPVS
ncbi:MAG: Uma2 family endonuclease [Labilithrix sp.]|nr:Uma2 family endonuclease [Labilithrix sp.]MCW5810615.1 Uma2 family endonuclease [Labilithrix sp.]